PDLEAAVLDNPDFTYDIESLLPPAIADLAGQDPTFKRKVARSILTNAQTLQDLEDARLNALTGKDCHLMSEFNDRTLVQVAYSQAALRKQRTTEIVGSAGDHIDNNGNGAIDEPNEARDDKPGSLPLPGWCADGIDNNGDNVADDMGECLSYDGAKAIA